jgi:hypothetical protein
MNEIVMSRTVTFLQTPLPPSERDVMVTSFMDNPQSRKILSAPECKAPCVSTEERERERERERGRPTGWAPEFIVTPLLASTLSQKPGSPTTNIINAPLAWNPPWIRSHCQVMKINLKKQKKLIKKKSYVKHKSMS